MDTGPRKERQRHPKDGANILSIASFGYIVKYLLKGRQMQMTENDLTRAMQKLQTKPLADRLENCWIDLKKNNPKPSLLKALTKCFGFSLVALFSTNLLIIMAQTYTHPWSIGRFVSYFEKGQTDITRFQAFIYAVIMLISQASSSLWREHYILLKTELGIQIENSVSSLIYRKLLVIHQYKNKHITTGKVITGLTKDIGHIKEVLMLGIDCVADITQLVMVIWMMYHRLGVASFSGVIIVLFITVIQVFLAKVTYTSRGICYAKSDQRLGQIQEVLSSIRLVKMYGWEEFFEKRLISCRRLELRSLFTLYSVKSLARIFGAVTGHLSHSSTLLLCLWIGNGLNADIVHFTKTCYHTASKALNLLPLGLQATSEFLMASKRLNIILHGEENQSSFPEKNTTLKPEIIFKETDVEVNDVKILKNINLELGVGLNILVGPSGSGKTSLLKTILEEYTCQGGKQSIRGSISYTAQNSWIFPSSLKQNILFGQEMDEERYKNVLHVCGLSYDLSTFLLGDETVLTDCGTNLSGGQQTRINLARALYKDSDIYLLDDCLASLDVNIKNHVFNKAIKGFLSNKLCLLVTHSTKFLDQADNVIIMDQGTIKYAGKPFNLPKELQEIEHINEDEEEIQETVEDTEENKEVEAEEKTSLLPKKEAVQERNIYNEKNNTGKVGLHVYKSYLMYGGGLCAVVPIVAIYSLSALLQGSGEKFLSKWLNERITNPNNTAWNSTTTNMTIPSATTTEGIFSEYSTNLYSTTDLYSTTTSPFNFSIPAYSQENITNIPNGSISHAAYFYLYCSIGTTFISSVISFIGIIAGVHFGLKIAKNIHKDMIYNLLRGCLYFFDTHLIGSILTRFSRDLHVLDERLPIFWNGIRTLLGLAVSLILIVSVGPVFLGMSIVLIFILYKITDYVLSTQRNLQRLNSSTLSPVLGHVNATLEGLTIIRTHGTQKILRDEYDKHLDLNMTAFHLKAISSNFVNFYCNTVGLIYSALVIITIFYMKDMLAGDAGLLLNQTHSLAHSLEIVLVLWSLMENSMTNVERILEYQKVPKEVRNKGRIVENWPSNGAIEFRNLSLSYRSDEAVLKDLNLTIHPEQKIGVVGRTGAGKSSIIMTLFRLYEYTGTLLIDGVDIKTLSLEFLRSHLAIIPQNPVIYTGTVRTNIDPFGTLDDERIWNILEIVNLKENFKSLEDDLKASNLSIGQKQLISIARALTKQTKIVILDEATANMDDAMDALIHEKINVLFKSCTVITIAHKLSNVLNSDMVIVMDKGRVVEFDSPQNLLSNTDGIFYDMLHQKRS